MLLPHANAAKKFIPSLRESEAQSKTPSFFTSSLPSFGHVVVANLWSFEFLWGAVVKDQWLIQLHQLFTQMDESRRSQNLIAATEMASLIQAASTNGTLAEMKEGSQQLVDTSWVFSYNCLRSIDVHHSFESFEFVSANVLSPVATARWVSTWRASRRTWSFHAFGVQAFGGLHLF